MSNDYTRDLLTGKVPYSDMVEAVRQAKAQAAAEEREACAKVADEALYLDMECNLIVRNIAVAIRARGKEEKNNE